MSWKISNAANEIIREDDGALIARTYGSLFGPHPNAHLIAAAPELYEALKYIIRALDEAGIIKANSIFMVTPNKAIAKASGK